MDAPAVIATRDDPAFRVRLPKPILKQLDRAAKQAGRSRNSEIVYRLAASLALVEPGKVTP